MANTETAGDKDRQTNIQTNRQKDKWTDRKRKRDKQTNKQRKKFKHTDRLRHLRKTEAKTERQTDTNGHAGRLW